MGGVMQDGGESTTSSSTSTLVLGSEGSDRVSCSAV
jgi:hypothetical protein